MRTIAKEIKYWKKNKLLPEVYCDYLLALYTKGEGITLGEYETPDKRLKLIRLAKMALQLLLLPFSFIVIYFTQYDDEMQMIILFLFIVFAFWQYKFFKKEQTIYYHLSMAVFLLLLLIVTIHIADLYIEKELVTYILLMMHFLGWLLLSRKNHSKYLAFASIFGILFTGVLTLF